MSLNSFNYSFGTQPGGGGFPGFSHFQQSNPGFYHQQSQFTLNQDPSTSAQQQIPVPNSITSNSDYYGNPQQQEQYNSGEQQQQGRKRRVKSGGRQARNYFHTPILTEQNDYHGHLAPIMGPIFVKNGHVPVIPLLSYPTVNNGTLLQIPILWTALSYALGLELRGEVLRGLPCIKRLNQLFCPTAGNAYPMKRIESFIDENKALIKRMYGEFMLDPIQGSNTLKRSTREVYEDEIPEFIGDGMARSNNRYQFTNGNSAEGNRTRRQTVNPKNGPPTQQPKSNRLDSCESTTDITTPYWAANSSGKVRAIVNTKHFEQAIHQEVCTKVKTTRCSDDCQCEQKYKWHRLLAYDPDNDCKGIFMDWFLFPSCCVCRCNPTRK